MKGYKVFNHDWTCRGFRYEVGKEYTMEEEPSVCNRGFHFCVNLNDCFDYYSFDPTNKVAEVEAFGVSSKDSDNSKHCTNGIRIMRELSWHEVLDLVNTGNSCSGRGNSGNCNSGNRNSGDRNSGDWNSGNCNSGNCNSGNCNSGNWNSGNRNSGNCNSGNRNSGNRNSGDCNSGNWNSGNRNSGDWNSGDWNLASCETGCFNTEAGTIRMFNKDSDIHLEDWKNSRACYLLREIPRRVVEWIYSEDMTDKEKKEHPDHETTGGYLKILDESECATDWWEALPESDKGIIKALPNFDFDIFCRCVGISRR